MGEIVEIKDFNLELEEKLMSFVTAQFGLEVFTPGLERTRPVYESFINFFKEREVKIITIAGTNGKGQTAHTLAAFLKKAQKKIALWTSPHILSLRERFVIGDHEVSYQELEWAMLESERILNEELQGIRVSFYEFLFLVFLVLAKKEQDLDVIILEVGLGGRLDAVNHFDADCTCITSISRDHQSILGYRYEQILYEKLGVTRAGKPLFTNFSLEYLNDLTKSYVDSHKIDWKKLKKGKNYFSENQEMAWAIFKWLLPDSDLDFKQATTALPLYKGRREIMTFQGMSLIFIGAHNIDGVRRMLQSYLESEDLILPDSLLVSFSTRPINEVEVMLKSLVDFFGDKSKITLTSFDHPKALDKDSILKACEKVNKGMLNFVFDWKSELKNSNSKTILVCGSYYFIGEVQRFINS